MLNHYVVVILLQLVHSRTIFWHHHIPGHIHVVSR